MKLFQGSKQLQTVFCSSNQTRDKDCGYLRILLTMEKVNKSLSQNNLKPEMCVGSNSESHVEEPWTRDQV
jgi:hypothetical protein